MRHLKKDVAILFCKGTQKRQNSEISQIWKIYIYNFDISSNFGVDFFFDLIVLRTSGNIFMDFLSFTVFKIN